MAYLVEANPNIGSAYRNNNNNRKLITFRFIVFIIILVIAILLVAVPEKDDEGKNVYNKTRHIIGYILLAPFALFVIFKFLPFQIDSCLT